MTEGRVGLRLKVLAMLVAFMFAALTTRLWFLQVLAAEDFKRQATDNGVRTVDVVARRGRILDDAGNVLVGNRMSLVVTVNRQEMGDHADEVVYNLAHLLHLSVKELADRIDTTLYYVYQPVPVATDVSKRIDFYISEHNKEFPGVEVAKMPVRTYPYGDIAAQVLGYLGQITPEKLKDPAFAGYQGGDLVGVAGVESQYEHELRGTEGLIKYRVNSAGQNLGPIGSRPEQPGNDVQLTIDAGIQQMTEEALRNGLEQARGIVDTASATGATLQANAGAVVVMDPTNGAIRAMTSFPTYDPSAFTRPMTRDEFETRFGAAKGNPLYDRATQGQYPPGSTYKPFIALSGLERGFLSTTSGYSCPPVWAVPGAPIEQAFHNWTTANLGYMNLAKALAVSCDTIFYPVGYDYWGVFYPPPWNDGITGNDSQRAKEPLQHDLRAIGFGEPTRVDLPYEKVGRVPDAEWKRSIHQQNPSAFPDGDWFPGDFVLMSIGQGDTLVTPLQIAQAYSAIMNDGRECTPHVGERIVDPDGGAIRRIKPRCHRLPFSPADVGYVKNALTGTVRPGGTAGSAFAGFPFSQVWVAGKTGTAQVTGKQDYSWFAGMTSSQGHEYVVVVLVEQGGHGSTTAAPIARQIIEQLYGLTPSGFVSGGVTD